MSKHQTMPDNSEHISAIDDAINAGVLSITVDGVTTRYRSLTDMRSIRRGLVATDTSGLHKPTRKRWASINIGGAAE